MKITFILNSVSGTKRNKEAIKKSIALALNGKNISYQIEMTMYAGHAKALSLHAAENYSDMVVAIGGDGTINEVAQALLNRSTLLGIVPIGSGNGFARHFHIPMSVVGALSLLKKHRRKLIDTATMNQRPFFGVAGIGFDAKIGHVFATRSRRGFLMYLQIILKELFQYRPQKYHIIVDGKKIKEKAFLITIANTSQFGNNAYISPLSKADDGFLDVCIMKPVNIWGKLRLALEMFTKKIHKNPKMCYVRGKSIVIQRESVEEPVHLDGESVFMQGDLHIKIHPKSLNLMISKDV